MNRTTLTAAVLLAAFFCHASRWVELSPAAESLNIHLRVEAGKKSSFGIEIARGDTLEWKRFEAVLPAQWPDDINTGMAVKIVFSSCTGGSITADSAKTATIYAHKPNSADISMIIQGNTPDALLAIGDRAVGFEAPIELCDTLPLFVRTFHSKDASPVRESISFEPKARIERSRFSSLEELYAYLDSSSDPHEGLWTFYDRATSPLRAAANGRYVVASVRATDGYELIYIDDLDAIPSPWKPLTVKAVMVPSNVPGVFDVVWFDRSQCEVKPAANAIIDGDIMTVNFPYYKTALRFAKSATRK